MNAIPPNHPNEAAARTSRHLRMCAELAELAMDLARGAAARTLTGWAEPGHPPAAEPPSMPTAQAQTNPEPPPLTVNPPRASAAKCAPHKQTDPAVLFTRFAAVARDCIALEARLAAGPVANPRAATLQLRADPRRAPLREAFTRALEMHPDRADLQRETTARLDEQLAADPTQTIALGNVFFNICDELCIEIDLAKVADEFLEHYRPDWNRAPLAGGLRADENARSKKELERPRCLGPISSQAEAALVSCSQTPSPHDDDAPDPCATSPP